MSRKRPAAGGESGQAGFYFYCGSDLPTSEDPVRLDQGICIVKNTKKTRKFKDYALTKRNGFVTLKNAENAQKITRQVCERSVLSRQVRSDTVRPVPFETIAEEKTKWR